ncbi:hypothetical protein JCM10212_001664 [Sporobolomyces blumeae]
MVGPVYGLYQRASRGGMIFLDWLKTQDPGNLSHPVPWEAKAEFLRKHQNEITSSLWSSIAEPSFCPKFAAEVKYIADTKREEEREAKEAEKIGARCKANVYVHVVKKEDEQVQAQLNVYRAHVYDDKQKTFTMFRVLRRHNHPSTDLFLDADEIRANPADHWLLSQPSTVPLSPAQVKRLDLDSLHEGQTQTKPLVFARFDPGPNNKGSNAVCRRHADAVQLSCKMRRPWSRGQERPYTGAAAGVGIRSDQRGLIGQYANYRVSATNKELHKLHTGERAFIAHGLLVAGAVLGGIIAHERQLTSEGKFPPVSLAGACTTASAGRGYQSLAHTEPADDAVFSFGSCFGSAESPPLGTFSFCLPAIDNGKGVVVESGPGVVMLWGGRRNCHTQANPLIPFEPPSPLSEVPVLPIEQEDPRYPPLS